VDNNLMDVVVNAVTAYATMGEICEVLRQVFGTYDSQKAA
jgi:methylmalonyl-CoA mutase N-terminal domain/subunit